MKKTEINTIAKIIYEDGRSVASRVAEALNITRQTASSKLSQMKKARLIESEGSGRGTSYRLQVLAQRVVTYDRKDLSEDLVWREQCLPMIADLADNVRGIWHHGITEMVNNAIDHSGSDKVVVKMKRDLYSTQCLVEDSGEGIFRKIQKAMNLYDPREAILELAKGKVTTDPENHSGEGIFFSSKMFDRFMIKSFDLAFVHLGNDRPDVLLNHDMYHDGTMVSMRLENESKRTSTEVFDQFALPEEFSFAKTLVPVRLAQYEGEALVSRSQAKRLTRRFERFQKVILDFAGVETIGQAFADEVFRVFAKAHPDLTMLPLHANKAVLAMIHRVQNPT